jgi:hypothetical protein
MLATHYKADWPARFSFLMHHVVADARPTVVIHCHCRGYTFADSTSLPRFTFDCFARHFHAGKKSSDTCSTKSPILFSESFNSNSNSNQIFHINRPSSHGEDSHPNPKPQTE